MTTGNPMPDRPPVLFALIFCLATALTACTSEARVPLVPFVPVDLYERSEDGGPRPTLYVSPDGDDTAPGTRDAPLRTIGRAADLATPGTLVRVAGGRYEGSVTTRTSGTADAPITYLSDPKDAAEVVGTGGEGGALRQKEEQPQDQGLPDNPDNPGA